MKGRIIECEKEHELGTLISNLRLGDDEMSFESYIHIEGEEITELELSIDVAHLSMRSARNTMGTRGTPE